MDGKLALLDIEPPPCTLNLYNNSVWFNCCL